MRHRLLSAVALFTVAVTGLIAACGSGGDSPAVEPIDGILVRPIEVTELTPASAMVRVETSIDVVCSVVYGTDEAYGSQSTDMDMGGMAHSDHAAPLRGLEPDTVYHYRLQGTGPDGTPYASEDRTFRTPPADDTEDAAGRNVAVAEAGAKVVEVSSVFGDSDAWAAANAIDGDPSTEWSSAGEGDDASVTVELAERQALSAIGLWSRTMGATGEIRRFQVVTDDGTVLGPFDLPDATQLYVFPVSATATRLRFEVVESTGGNTGAVEIAAFGVSE